MEFLIEYGLFLAKSLTVLTVVVVVIAILFGASQRQRDRSPGHIEVKSLNDSLDELTRNLKTFILRPESQKLDAREEKKKTKERKKTRKQEFKEGKAQNPRLFVLDFKGDIQATQVTSLREEITAVLSVAGEQDEVLMRLESPGGVVHGYGLAASQLQRIRNKSIKLTVAVDKVAASGGYMMACIANEIIAAPFALLGSIGVVAQLPNFHRLLQKNDIDFELLTAGKYKRTLTLFGENTDQAREKFTDDLEEVHRLFKELVAAHRPAVNIEEVATGEAWFGSMALEKALVDELKTSDEYIVEQCAEKDVFRVSYVLHKNKLDRLLEKTMKVFRPMDVRNVLPEQHIQ